MTNATLTSLRAHEESLRTDIADYRRQERDTTHLGELLQDVRREMRERFPCETCCGSGMVAVGPWGSRPPRVTCPDCEGTRIDSRTLVS